MQGRGILPTVYFFPTLFPLLSVLDARLIIPSSIESLLCTFAHGQEVTGRHSLIDFKS